MKGRRRGAVRSTTVLGFNPRPREGATGGDGSSCYSYSVSIHAPVKGRLRWNVRTNAVHRVSIHAPVKGRRGDSGLHRKGSVSIHAPVKGRPLAKMVHIFLNRFNPRPREGATLQRLQRVVEDWFQSTPP